MLRRFAGVLPLLLLGFLLRADEAKSCYLRVTVLETEPKVAGTLTSLMFVRPAPATHLFFRKAVFGADGSIVECKTGFHDVIDWDAAAGAAETPVGTPGRWVDITKEAFAPHWTESHWHKPHGEYARSTLHLGFFSRENDGRKSKKPVSKRLETGNLDCVRVRVDFAKRPAEEAIFRSVEETAHWGGVGFLVDMNAEPEGARVVSMLEGLSAIESSLRKKGYVERDLPKRIVTAGREYLGYFSPLYSREVLQKAAGLYRLMGFTSVLYSTKDQSAEFDEIANRFCNPVFDESTRPDWVGKSPADPEMDAKSRKIGAKFPVIEKPRLVKCGDETTVLKEKLLQLPEVRRMFAAFLSERKVDPKELGVATLDEVPFVTAAAQADTPAKRRAYYYTGLFRSEAMLGWYKQLVDGMKAGYAGKMAVTGEICWENNSFPDILRAFDLGVYDVSAHECASMLWVMPHGALYRLIAQRSGGRYGRTLPGVLYGSFRGRMPEIAELEGTSALIHGMRNFYWYDSTLCNLKDVAYYENMKKANDRFSRYEDAVLGWKSELTNPPALVVKSYAGELWQSGAMDPLYQEFEMSVAGLVWNQIAFDILNDEMAIRHLKNYKVVYLTSPVLPRASCAPLEKWVRQGGVLVLVGNTAATKNEFDEDQPFGVRLAGAAAESGFQVRKLERGRVCRIAGSPAADLKASFDPAENPQISTHTSCKQVFHRIGEAETLRYAEPFRFLADRERPVLCDRRGVDVGVFENADATRAVLIAADYTDPSEKEIVCRLLLNGKYVTAKDEAGRAHPVVRSGGRTVVKVPVGISTVVTLEKN